MSEIQSIRGKNLPAGTAVSLGSLLEITPPSVDLITRWMFLIIDALGVEIVHVRARVRERPCQIAIESDHYSRHSGESCAGSVELSRDDDVHLVPD